jgi:hypothetical protein
VKIKPCKNNAGQIVGWSFFCPGCRRLHVYYVTTGNLTLLNTCEDHPDPAQRRCHLNLTNGKLHFHNDCSHSLAGATVDLPELSDIYTQEDPP